MEGFSTNLVCLMWRHENYWVRLTTQRIFGFVFSYLQDNPKHSMQSVLAIQQEDLLKLIYEFLTVFKFSHITEELTNQLVRNLVFIARQIMALPDGMEMMIKVIKKASYIGRRHLGMKNESTDTLLSALIQWYTVLATLLKEKEGWLESCTAPILELVYRTYTNDRLGGSVKDESTELIDFLSSSLDKDFFITRFNEVQQGISKNRADRRLKTKLSLGTEAGQVIMAKRKAKKTQKLTARRKEKQLRHALLK